MIYRTFILATFIAFGQAISIEGNKPAKHQIVMFEEYKPVIGILTQPVKAKKRKPNSKPAQFDHDEYIL